MANKAIVWEGDSLEKLKAFPEEVRKNIGNDLRRLQCGKAPLDSKSIKSIERGVYELRDADSRTWYRVIYYTKIEDIIFVLHVFIKKGNKTSKKDIKIVTKRLKNLKARMIQGKRDDKEKNDHQRVLHFQRKRT